MKKIFTLLAAVLMTANVLAQAPQTMGYQAVIRNSANALVTTQVGMRISILQATSTGTAVYVETQTPTPNANGLVSLAIGGGTATTGTFAGIDWSAGPYFIKTETDPAGGTSYSITGTSQLLSVPYALNAGSITNTNGLALPKLTTTQRAALVSPSVGTLIYNTTLNKFQGYSLATTSTSLTNMTGIVTGFAVGANSGIGQTFTSTGSWVFNGNLSITVFTNPGPTAGVVTLSLYSGVPGSGTLKGSVTANMANNAPTVIFTIGSLSAITIPAGPAYWTITTDGTATFTALNSASAYIDSATESAFSIASSNAPNTTTPVSGSYFFNTQYAIIATNPSWVTVTAN
jgi:hypothetical protein